MPLEKIYLDDTTHLVHRSRPPFLKGGAEKFWLLKKILGAGKKFLKGGGLNTKRVPLLKGGGLGKLR